MDNMSKMVKHVNKVVSLGILTNFNDILKDFGGGNPPNMDFVPAKLSSM
jgi:hypothetical protein